MIDIGANLSSSQFKEDIKEVLVKSAQADLEALVLTSTDWNTYLKNIEIIQNYSDIIPLKTTFGLHPHSVAHHEIIFKNIHTVLSQPEVLSIGEFGLDYFRMIGEKSTQLEVMEKFMDISLSYPHLGLFLHERGSFEDFHAILKSSKSINKKVVHCFTGNLYEARAYLDLDCYLGITGWISDKRRNTSLLEALEYIPLDKLMVETDCPYLTPFNMPKRIQRNEPSNLKYIIESISDIKKIDVEEVKFVTTKNALDFFSIPHYNKKNKL